MNIRARRVNAINSVTVQLVARAAPELQKKAAEVFPHARAMLPKAVAAGVRIACENCDMGGWWHDVRWNVAYSPK